MGFFTGSELAAKSKPPQSSIPECGACGLLKKCQSPKLQPAGKGQKKILLVLESPTQEEDEAGKVLWGLEERAPLVSALRDNGINPTRDCVTTFAVICHPKKLDEKMAGYCRPNLIKTIKEVGPHVIVPMGQAPIQSVISYAWEHNKTGNMSRWTGWHIPSQKLNAWIAPTSNPAWIVRNSKQQRDNISELFFAREVAAAVKLHRKRPWKTVPDYKSQVKRVTDPNQAVTLIERVIKRNKPTAYDYECNMLKPDPENRAIVSCAMSNGGLTFAYPWTPKTAEATRKFLRSPVPKIGANIKFEERWNRAAVNTPARNWIWDTTLNAHIIDNRENITSVAFQSFVLLGLENYDDHIKPFLKSKEGMNVNRILDEIEINDLLLYNGLDALVEYKIAYKQAKHLGVTL